MAAAGARFAMAAAGARFAAAATGEKALSFAECSGQREKGGGSGFGFGPEPQMPRGGGARKQTYVLGLGTPRSLAPSRLNCECQ
eukprot:50845-Chlamydomonas_euryale.AAC.1